MTRLPLSLKISLLAFLNVFLLVLVFGAFARFQFRMDVGSFLFAPARDRMISVSRLLAIELEHRARDNWDQLLQQYSATYPATFYLFDGEAGQMAGAPVQLPSIVSAGILRSARMHDPEIPRPRNAAPRTVGPPPVISAKSSGPDPYWVGVPIPIFTAPRTHPIHGTLVWRFSSPWTNSFFFDYRPWLTVVLAVALISIACWLPLIRGLTRAIGQMTTATGQIAEGRFEVELPVKRTDELGQLSASINQMARRLADFVHGQRRFLSDIAHELCSPVARMQAALGILEQHASEKDAAYVADVTEDLNHMSSLINELLSFSKAQLSPEGAQLTRVNVADTVRRVLDRERSDEAVIENRIREDVEVIAQPEYLFRSLSNLVRNAIRYAAHGGPIVLAANRGKGQVSITVSDNGPGLPETELQNVFKPFYRPEFARQRETGGTGLGLAIVKSCVESCGGAVECRRRSPRGLEVEIRLPAADPSVALNT